MDNQTLDNASEVTGVEDRTHPYSWPLFLLLTSIGGVIIPLDSLCIVAMKRSKHTPFPARYLSIFLLFTDCVYMALTILYQIPCGRLMETMILELLTLASYESYITVTLMSLERLVLFKCPFWYRRFTTNNAVRRVATIVWTVVAVTYLVTRFPVCKLSYGDLELESCRVVLAVYLGITVTLELPIFVASYAVIIPLVCARKPLNGMRRHKLTDSKLSCRKFCTQYRMTSAILIYMTVTLISFVAMLVIAQLFTRATLEELLEIGHIVTYVGCVCNPIVYVVWFKDCQAEMLKLIPFLSRRYCARRDRLEMKIFNINTS